MMTLDDEAKYYEKKYTKYKNILIINEIDLSKYEKEMAFFDKIQFLYEEVLECYITYIKYYQINLNENVKIENEEDFEESNILNQILIEYLESYVLYLISNNEDKVQKNKTNIEFLKNNFAFLLQEKISQAYVMNSSLNSYYFLGDKFYDIDITNKQEIKEISRRYQRFLNNEEDSQEITLEEKDYLFKYLILHMEDKELKDIRDYYIKLFFRNKQRAKQMTKVEKEFFINYVAYVKSKKIMIPVPKIYIAKNDINLNTIRTAANCNLATDGSTYIEFNEDILEFLLPLVNKPIERGKMHRDRAKSLTNVVFHELEHSFQAFATFNDEINENSYCMGVYHLLCVDKKDVIDTYIFNHDAYLLEIKADLQSILDTIDLLKELDMEDIVYKYNMYSEYNEIKRSLITLKAKVDKHKTIPYVVYEIGNVSDVLNKKYKNNDTDDYEDSLVLQRIFNKNGSIKYFTDLVLQYEETSVEEKKIYYNVINYYLLYHDKYGKNFKNTKIKPNYLETINLGELSKKHINAFYEVFTYHIRKTFKEILILVTPDIFVNYNEEVVEAIQLRINCLKKETDFILRNKEYFDDLDLDITSLIQYFKIVLERFNYLVNTRKRNYLWLGYDKMLFLMNDVLSTYNNNEENVKKLVK